MKIRKELLIAQEGLKPKTLVELYGAERLLVEHHGGIRSYGTERIRIAATFGCLVVEGCELRLCCMSRSQLVIRGRIDSIIVEGGS